MKYRIVRIANPNYIDDLSEYDNEEFPNMVSYVGNNDSNFFVVEDKNSENFYPASEFFFMMPDLRNKTIFIY